MTLENRRIWFYLIILYKIYNLQVDVPILKQKLTVNINTTAINLRTRNTHFRIALIRNNLHKNSPLIKAMELFNPYSQHLSFDMTLEQFRSSCKELLLFC
uniref:Uncharacterized protein n=1 Tax=Cacopsylla melanoneura TaxID=428564 RepID=A0A8D8WJ83_9HEMI